MFGSARMGFAPQRANAPLRVMAKLKEKKIMLGVANPRVRTSQVLTLTKGFVYDEDRRSWTRVPHGGEASTSTGGDIDLS